VCDLVQVAHLITPGMGNGQGSDAPSVGQAHGHEVATKEIVSRATRSIMTHANSAHLTVSGPEGQVHAVSCPWLSVSRSAFAILKRKLMCDMHCHHDS